MRGTVTEKPSDWIHTHTADNALATATKAAPSAGVSHFITHIAGGYTSAVSGRTLILKSGTTELGRWLVYDTFALVLPSPIVIPSATVANLELQASGTGGVSGSATMAGYAL